MKESRGDQKGRPGKAVEKRSGGREEGTEREATKEPE